MSQEATEIDKSTRAIGKSETSRALSGCSSVCHFLNANAHAKLYTHAAVRQKGHSIPLDKKVMQAPNHDHVKTQA